MITTKNILFSYNKKTEFKFPDIHCNSSEVLLITGGSGKGKTTLLHLISGLLKMQSGEITINEIAIEKLSEKKLDSFRGKNIGFVLQQSHFIEALTVIENIVIASYLATGKKEYQKALELLIELDLESEKDKLTSQLSIGQQQRVAIARALINEPKVILADEPTSSLDDDNALVVVNLLEKLAKKHQAALLVVTHDSRLKTRFANQISLS